MEAQSDLALIPDEREFLDASLADRERQAAGERERQQRELATAQHGALSADLVEFGLFSMKLDLPAVVAPTEVRKPARPPVRVLPPLPEARSAS